MLKWHQLEHSRRKAHSFSSCLLSELQQLEYFPSVKLRRFCGLRKKKKNATGASVEDSIFLRNIIITPSGGGLDGCLCHLLRLLTFLNCFCGENVSVLVFFFICFLSFFFKPSPSYRSLVSCRSSCTEGTLRTSKNKKMQNVAVEGGMRRGLKGKR